MSVPASARQQIAVAKNPVRAARRLKQPIGAVGLFASKGAPAGGLAPVATALAREASSRHQQFLQSPSPEAVHELRRALRRVRALVSLFADDLPAGEAAFLGKEIRLMTRSLGAIRDLDVLHARLMNETDYTPQTVEEDALVGIVTSERTALEPACAAAAESARATLLFAGLGPWMESRGAVLKGRSTLWRRLLPRLREQDAAILKAGRNIDSLTRVKRHRLRSQVKMLRYALEATPWLCPPHDGYVTVLGDLHTRLGDLNDLSVGHRLLKRLCAEHSLKPPRHHRGDVTRIGRKELAAAWARFEAAPADWLYGPQETRNLISSAW